MGHNFFEFIKSSCEMLSKTKTSLFEILISNKNTFVLIWFDLFDKTILQFEKQWV